MPASNSSKARLRSDLRQRRRDLSEQQQHTTARAVAQHFKQLPNWTSARRVALYLAQDGEVSTHFLSVLCREHGITLFLPVINPDKSLRFAQWDADAVLQTNRYGIPEPPDNAPGCGSSELDILAVPLVGWDRQGGRLGMGGGFYDRTLAGLAQTLLVGLAHSVQEVERIPREPWDISMNFVITGAGLHRCSGAD